MLCSLARTSLWSFRTCRGDIIAVKASNCFEADPSRIQTSVQSARGSSSFRWLFSPGVRFYPILDVFCGWICQTPLVVSVYGTQLRLKPWMPWAPISRDSLLKGSVSFGGPERQVAGGSADAFQLSVGTVFNLI